MATDNGKIPVERAVPFETSAGKPVAPLYTPDDLSGFDYNEKLGFPGEYPYTRGVQPTMYRGRFWTMRQYAGFSDAEESNRRYKYLLSQGQTGLSVAFDLPTQIGYDPDDEMAEGEVGKVGVSICSIEDMETLFRDIPLETVTTSMTINATASILLALYVAVAKKQGADMTKVGGTTQNDILKEYIARGTYIFPPRPSLRLITDVFAYCNENLPSWNTISISGYHMREAGCTAAQEVGFTIANAIQYTQAALDRGLRLDDFAPRLAFFFACHGNFLEEIAKFRAARRLWARTFGTTTLGTGTHTITAVYGGDTNFAVSSSANYLQTISAATLQVSTFTPTSTGFTAVFNRTLNVGTISAPLLNLYDNSTGTMGPADITLVGSTTGTIRGSLVVDPTDTTITFIQTGQTGVGPANNKGILPNDTYTVTLRSASNGFKDASNNLLDGNADGTPGDNYVTTFVVNTPTNSVVVSLPDFARGASQDVNVPATSTSNGLPLRVLNQSAGAVTITSVAFNVKYDSSLLTITGAAIASGVPGGSTFSIDTSTAGLAIVTFNSPAGIQLGPNTGQNFLNLTATVPTTAGYAEKEILDLQSLQVNSGALTAVADDAIHVSAFLGDTTRDEIYTGLDAQRISRVAVGLDPGFRQWLLADPLILGDVSGDGQLTGVDALQIARQSVGITQSTIPGLPSVTPAIIGPDPVLSIPSDFNAAPGADLVVPVNLDHPNGLASVDLAISYDTSRLDVSSAAAVQRGSLTGSFDNFAVNLDRAAGVIRISGYASASPIAGSTAGTLALITFQVRANAPAGPAVVNLLQNAGTSWSLPGGTDAQGNDFLFNLQPRPSNAAGDALDGRINVNALAQAAVRTQPGVTNNPGTDLLSSVRFNTQAQAIPLSASELASNDLVYRVGIAAVEPTAMLSSREAVSTYLPSHSSQLMQDPVRSSPPTRETGILGTPFVWENALGSKDTATQDDFFSKLADDVSDLDEWGMSPVMRFDADNWLMEAPRDE